MLRRDPLYVSAGPILILPEADKQLDAIKRKSEVPYPVNEPQRSDIGLRVDPVTSLGPTCLPEKTDTLILPKHLG